MDTVAVLQALGFTEYEARAYTALLEDGALSGYELAKKSGIPRANIYAVADKLLERGAVQREPQPGGGQRYSPVPPKQLLRGIEAGHKRALSAAKRALARLPHRRRPATVFSLHGRELLVAARQLIDTCGQELVLAIQQPEAAALAEPLRMARERGVAITTLCLEACEHECGGCQGEIHRYQLAPRDGRRWLVLASDRTTALIGQFSGEDIEGVVTEQHLVVELATAYVRQSLALAVLGSELGGRFQGLLSQQAMGVLGGLYPDEEFPAYLRKRSSTKF